MLVDPKIGRFLLESITRGLYEDPLCILREYVQNSVDSIDRLVASGEMRRDAGTIWITIDPTPSKRSITITDNGIGLTVDEAKRELSNIGESQKKGPEQRGFRGIGRLGGIAYCETLIFRTKSPGSNEEIENTWDCAKIKKMLNPNNHEYNELNLADVVKACSSFEIQKTARKEESFFQVEMINVQCTKDRLLDIVTVRDYLSTVAPVPFDYLKFPYGNEIHERLMREVDNYGTYKILVNNEEILKPYTVSLILHKNHSGNCDRVVDIIWFDIKDDSGEIIAKGWYGKRENCLGQILKVEKTSGIRVRVGNILIGDDDLLNRCFKEDRFNGYFIGEIHVIDPELIPNSRRDDFEDSDVQDIFYLRIRSELGEPLSQEIRRISNETSIARREAKAEEKRENEESLPNPVDITIKANPPRGGCFSYQKSDEDKIINLRDQTVGQSPHQDSSEPKKLTHNSTSDVPVVHEGGNSPLNSSPAEGKQNEIDLPLIDNTVTGGSRNGLSPQEIKIVQEIASIIRLHYGGAKDADILIQNIAKTLELSVDLLSPQ